MDSKDFLDLVAGYVAPQSATPEPRLGTIDAAYSGGKPRIKFDGESTTSVKQYAVLGSYTPVAGERVLLEPVGGSYVVVGSITDASVLPKIASWSAVGVSTFSVATGTRTKLTTQITTSSPGSTVGFTWNSSTGALTIPYTGLYQVGFHYGFLANPFTNGSIKTYITLNDDVPVSTASPNARTSLVLESEYPPIAGFRLWTDGTIQRNFTAGDVLRFYVEANGGSSYDVFHGTPYSRHNFHCRYVGPV